MFVGRALSDGYRQRVKLATKLPSRLIERHEELDNYHNTQLKRLQTDKIDYYLLHSLTGELWMKMESLDIKEFLDTAKADGRIGCTGFSFHGNGKDFQKIIDAYNWDFCQIQYNFLDKEKQAGTTGLKYAASKGIGIIVMEPLRGGSLTNSIPQEVQEIWDKAEVKRTPAEWALRWVWNHPEVTVVLSGMNEETHIEENIAIADQAYPHSLTKPELDLINNVERKYFELFKVSCTGCKYCVPCPAGVNIPLCFDIYNSLYLNGNIEQVKSRYTTRLSGARNAGKPEYASQCIQCNMCLEKCSQQIDIPTVLKTVDIELGKPDPDTSIS